MGLAGYSAYNSAKIDWWAGAAFLGSAAAVYTYNSYHYPHKVVTRYPVQDAQGYQAQLNAWESPAQVQELLKECLELETLRKRASFKTLEYFGRSIGTTPLRDEKYSGFDKMRDALVLGYITGGACALIANKIFVYKKTQAIKALQSLGDTTLINQYDGMELFQKLRERQLQLPV